MARSKPVSPTQIMQDHLPPAVTRWFGLRVGPPKPIPPYMVYFWTFIGVFGGLAVVQAVFGQASYFIQRGVPRIVASYGASAVLVYGAIDVPLAQPRALIGGHFISALVGVVVSTIFDLHVVDGSVSPPRLIWLASSLSVAIAVVLMQLTKTTHPPAGATALLPMSDPNINRLGWYLLPVVLLSSVLLLAVGLLTNNIQRRYPTFWWSPEPPKKEQQDAKPPSPPPQSPHNSDEQV